MYSMQLYAIHGHSMVSSWDFRSTSFIGNGVLQEYFAKKSILQLLLLISNYCCFAVAALQLIYRSMVVFISGKSTIHVNVFKV